MINSLDKLIEDGVERGLLQRSTSNDRLDSAEISVDNKTYVNFGSCSYLGLEYHTQLKEAVKNTVDDYGTQFSTSRTYLSIGLYDKLETELRNIFKKPVIASASTTLGHLAALPVIVGENDVVILDLQVHSSVQMAAQILKGNKVPVFLVPHNDMEALETKIKTLGEKADKVWYMVDGVYSMYGDYAPLSTLENLLNKYKKFHLYIDDAHGMSWTGTNGVGYVRSVINHHDKMVLATSLNKSFAAAGGVLVFPNQEVYRKVKNCGTTLIFSGPIQPPMLGAGIASGKLHQTAGFVTLQNELKDKIAFTNKKLNELDLPQFEVTDSPLFFIPVGLPSIIANIIRRMKERGYFLNSAGYPATPIKRGGIRFMITNNLSVSQIESMLSALKEEYINGLVEEGSSPAYVAKQFRIPVFLKDLKIGTNDTVSNSFLRIDSFSSIEDVSATMWNELFASHGLNSYENLLDLEQVFSKNLKPEDNWRFGYTIIKDANDEVVLAGVFATSLMMEDLLADKSISEKIKKLRVDNPYYLTSETLLTGTPFTKGKSLNVNYEHSDWKYAVKQYVELLQRTAEEQDVSKIILRDFTMNEHERLSSYLLELGFLNLDFPNNCVVENLDWQREEDYLKRLTQKYRYSLRKEILIKEENFIINYEKPKSQEDIDKVISLYKNVHNKSTEIAVFELPKKLFKRFKERTDYDFINIYLKEKPELLIGVLISVVINNVYYAQLVGLDYNYSIEKGVYKQLLYQAVKRARQLNCIQLDLAYTAELEKKKVGAKIQKMNGFVMALEHDNYLEMQLLK
jgi:7-keto-8-aminopelargonate synthetase-like enzyme/predicted N-acyltransferase